MTFEQFLESYGLEEDFQDSGMTPKEYLESVFEEEVKEKQNEQKRTEKM